MFFVSFCVCVCAFLCRRFVRSFDLLMLLLFVYCSYVFLLLFLNSIYLCYMLCMYLFCLHICFALLGACLLSWFNFILKYMVFHMTLPSSLFGRPLFQCFCFALVALLRFVWIFVSSLCFVLYFLRFLSISLRLLLCYVFLI